MYIFIIYFLLAGLFLLGIKNQTKLFQKLIVIVSIFVIVLMTVRYNIGTDVFAYEELFANVSSQNFFSIWGNRSITFKLLFKIGYYLGLNNGILILLLNIINSALLVCVVKKYSRNPLVSLLVFVGTGLLQVYYISALRQMLAMSVFAYAYFFFLEEHKVMRYLLFCLIGLTIHETAAIMLLVLFLKLIYKKIIGIKYFYIYIILISLLCLLFFYNSILLDKLSFLGFYITRYLGSKSFNLIGLIFRIALFFLFFILYTLQNEKKKYSFFIFLEFCMLSIYIAFSLIPIFARVSDFIGVIEIVYVANLLEDIQSEKRKIVMFLMVFLFNLVLLYDDTNFIMKHRTTNQSVVRFPYVSVFNYQDIRNYYNSPNIKR